MTKRISKLLPDVEPNFFFILTPCFICFFRIYLIFIVTLFEISYVWRAAVFSCFNFFRELYNSIFQKQHHYCFNASRFCAKKYGGFVWNPIPKLNGFCRIFVWSLELSELSVSFLERTDKKQVNITFIC